MEHHTGPISEQSLYLDTILLIGLRLGFGVVCQRVLLSTLNPTLRELSTSEASSSLPTVDLHGRGSFSRPTLDLTAAADTDEDVSIYNTSPASTVPPSPSYPTTVPLPPIDDGFELAELGSTPNRAAVLQLDHGTNSTATSKTKRSTRGIGRLARLLFCACFAEACNLVALVLFHEIGFLHLRSRQFNFAVSLHLTLGIVLLVVPLIQCLLLTYRSSVSATMTTSKLSFRSRLLVALIPFALYCFLFTCIPPYVNSNSAHNTENYESDTQATGWFAATLGRIVVLGIVTLGGLSGFGAMRTASRFFEHVRHGRSQALSEMDISRAEQSLSRVRQEIVKKREEVTKPRPPAQNKSAQGWIVRLIGDRDANGLAAELKGLEAMERQMSRSLLAGRRRKMKQEFGRTFLGRMYYLLGFCFALYCAARLLMCVPSIFFPPVSRDLPTTKKGNSNGDWISYLLAVSLSYLPGGTTDVNVALWSRTISLLLTGVLILSSLAQILRSVSKVVRLTSKAAGASFLLLGLGQLFAVYVISLLVQIRTSLPPSPEEDDSEESSELLETLPDFRTFGRLFDSVFLLVAFGTALYRYIAHKVDSTE